MALVSFCTHLERVNECLVGARGMACGVYLLLQVMSHLKKSCNSLQQYGGVTLGNCKPEQLSADRTVVFSSQVKVRKCCC